jgi:hypothetical protein
MDITPDTRDRFPSGSRIPIEFPPDNVRARIIWIDGKRFAEAKELIAQFKAGRLTARAAEDALYELAYAPGAGSA